MVVLCRRDRLGKLLDRLAQRRAVVQHDRLVKALHPTLIRHQAQIPSAAGAARRRRAYFNEGRACRLAVPVLVMLPGSSPTRTKPPSSAGRAFC